jgi:hypothetical protein
MPSTVEFPSAATLRKRLSRANMRAADAGAYLAKEATLARSYRLMVKTRKQADQILPPDGIDVPEYMQKISDCREKLCANISEIMTKNLENNATPERIEAMRPVIQMRVKEAVVLAKLKLDSITSNATLVDRITKHAAAEFENGGVKLLSKDSAATYVSRLVALQTRLIGTVKPLDLKNFVDHKRMLDLVQKAKTYPTKGKAATATKAAIPPKPATRWSVSNRVGHLTALSSISDKFELLTSTHKIYQAAFFAEQLIESGVRVQNVSTANEKDKWVAWPIIAAKMKLIAKTPGTLTPRQIAIMSIYVDIPPRRVKDYALMKITYAAPTDTNFNWMVLSAAGRPKKMIINQYKTANQYGVYTLNKIPAALADSLQSHIIDAKLSEGNALFGTKKNACMTSSAFSTVVGDTMEIILKKRTTVNIFRHSRIVEFLKSSRLSVAQKLAMAAAMAHSMTQQMYYNRLDTDSESIEIPEDSDDEGEIEFVGSTPGTVEPVKPVINKSVAKPKSKSKRKSTRKK